MYIVMEGLFQQKMKMNQFYCVSGGLVQLLASYATWFSTAHKWSMKNLTNIFGR